MASGDYWIIPLDGAYAVRSARGVELEGISSYGDAQAHILDLEEVDRIEAEETAAALADYDALMLAEAA